MQSLMPANQRGNVLLIDELKKMTVSEDKTLFDLVKASLTNRVAKEALLKYRTVLEDLLELSADEQSELWTASNKNSSVYVGLMVNVIADLTGLTRVE